MKYDQECIDAGIIYEKIRAKAKLKFLGMRNHQAVFHAKAGKFKLELTYDAEHLWEMDYDPQSNDYFPPWEEIEDSGYSDVLLTDGVNSFDFHDFR